MNKESFDKIIQLNQDITIDDVKNAIEYYITLKDQKQINIFKEKFKFAIINLLNTLLHKVDKYPSTQAFNKDILTIDKLLYFSEFIYGSMIFTLFNKNTIVKDLDIYYQCINVYLTSVRGSINNDKDTLNNIELYKEEKHLKKLFNNVPKQLLENSYNIYFSLKNYLDKEDYEKRAEEFITLNNINYDIFINYVKTYALLYLNLSIKEINININNISNAMNRKFNNINRLESAIYKIIVSSDINDIKKYVYFEHITPYVVKSFIESSRYYYNMYSSEKDLICNKVNKALKLLEDEHKYIHYSVALSIIENTNDYNLLKEIVRNNINSLTKINISTYIYTYKAFLSNKEKIALAELLTDKINDIKDKIINDEKMRKQQVKETNLISEYTNIDFSLFLLLDIKNIDEFCDMFHISRYEFNKYLSVLEKDNNKLYLKIKDKLNNLKKQRYAVLNNKVSFIVDSIINGIKKEDDSIREFEILDYFLNTKLDFKDFINIYNDKDSNTLKALKTFFAKNKLTSKININQELSGKTIFMINNSPYEVTKEEKLKVINFLKDKEIPLYTKVYKQALKRYVNGDLILEDDKTLIKSGN